MSVRLSGWWRNWLDIDETPKSSLLWFNKLEHAKIPKCNLFLNDCYVTYSRWQPWSGRICSFSGMFLLPTPRQSRASPNRTSALLTWQKVSGAASYVWVLFLHFSSNSTVTMTCLGTRPVASWQGLFQMTLVVRNVANVCWLVGGRWASPATTSLEKKSCHSHELKRGCKSRAQHALVKLRIGDCR